MVEITFLGTGGARYVMYSQERGTAGFIVKTANEQIHIDPGPGSLIRAKQFCQNLENNTILLVSHEHCDHSSDLNCVIGVMTKGELTKGLLVTNKAVVEEVLKTKHKKLLEKLVVLSPDDETKIRNVRIKATNTKNHDGCIGFKLFSPEITLGYTGDTAYSAILAKEFAGCDVIIINNVMPFNKKIARHLCSDDTVKFLEKVKPKLAIIQHFGRHMLKANPLYEARAITKKTGVQVVAATDGLTIDPLAYSAKSNQRHLSQF